MTVCAKMSADRVRLLAEVALWTATAILAGLDVFLIGIGLLFNDTRVEPEQIIFHVGKFVLVPIGITVTASVISRRMRRRHFLLTAVFFVAVPALSFWGGILCVTFRETVSLGR